MAKLTLAALAARMETLEAENADLKNENTRLEKAGAVRSVQKDTSVQVAKDNDGHGCGIRFYAPKGNKPAGAYYEVTWTTARGERFARFPVESGDLFVANHDKVTAALAN